MVYQERKNDDLAKGDAVCQIKQIQIMEGDILLKSSIVTCGKRELLQ